ncbi:MAG: AMP-binding protein [Bacteroidetes bacterium]|nr:AMP-binding protein [Bacteroidota bacterium]
MKILIAIYRFFLSLRYKIELKGVDVLKTKQSKLILPNHQALVDPQILFTHILKYTKAVPVASEIYANKPVLKQLFNIMGTVVVSDITTNNRDTDALKNIYSNVVHALENGKSVLLYPSGQIAGQGYEKIFNKQSAWAIVDNIPENTQIIGVRISGLWGSMWSRAWIGKAPNFFKTFLKAIFYVFANLIFFLPRRKVCVEFVDITAEAKIKSKENRLAFNQFLERFYNINGEEKLLYLKHYFYAPELKLELPERIEGSVEDMMRNKTAFSEDIPDEIFLKVAEIIVKTTNIVSADIKMNSNLVLELNVDSLMLVSIISDVETAFNVVSQIEIEFVTSVEDLCRIAMGQEVSDEILKPSFIRKRTIPLKDVEIDKTKNIVESFLAVFSKDGKEQFTYDKIIGSSSRKDFMLKAYVVSRILKKEVKGKHVGIMLPALQSTTLLVMASYLAGKIPVMLNWTVGKKVLDHCVEDVNLDIILTAKSFHDKVQDLLSDNVKQKCVFFEQKVRETSLLTKFAGLIHSYLKTKPAIEMDDTAVILFTSGSESLPKAVPLTHRNIVSDLWGVFELIKLNNDYILLSFLPPFHSFGFSVLTILPLITGLKVAYTPDPTDSREVLKILKHSGANTLLATPTFLKMMLAVSSQDDLKQVILAITGAESLHASIINAFYEKADSNAHLLEGYGITECSPVLTINTFDMQKEKSVGRFIEGVDFLIVDYNNYTLLPQGSEGMIMVKGESIFNGYIDKKIASPFVIIDGKEYYKTGDLGRIDDDGFLFITGRLKRFIKIAGEMISLPAIEGALLKKYGNDDEVVLAVEGNDSIEPPQIVLFSKINIDLTEANAYLKESGFPNLVKLNKLIEVEEIPLLGTGKTDYKVLKQLIV